MTEYVVVTNTDTEFSDYGRNHMRVPILLTTYNRPKALRRTLESLGRTNTGWLFGGFDMDLVIQDDGSSKETYQILEDVDLWAPFRTVRVFGLDGGHGGEPNRARRRVLSKVFESPRTALGDPLFVVTIESDLVFNPYWLGAIISVWLTQRCALALADEEVKTPATFATISPYHGAFHSRKEEKHEGFALRRATGGVCHLITRDWYEIGKEPGGWMAWEKKIDGKLDWPEGCGGWDSMMATQAKRLDRKFFCLVPSLVDHVPGEEGGTSGSILWKDRAVDFVGEQHEYPADRQGRPA